jgi:tetratricopeptide (TPR) repeat protein
MSASLRAVLGASLMLGAVLLLGSSLPTQAQDPGGQGLNLQNPYAQPNAPGSGSSKLNEEITPRNEEYAKAVALVQDGQYNDAMLILNKLIAMDPIDADALNQLGFCYQKLGQPGKAMSYYKKVLSTKPEHLGANENAGELFLEMKDLPKAEERLTVLEGACADCQEYNQLKAKIVAYKLAAQG